MSEIKVNKISPRTACGTTTLGDSGDTFTIPAGVTITNNGTQTGFGRTGTVDWDTTPKTATFSAVSGDGFFCNTTSSAFTCNLPAGSAGAIVSLADYAGTWQTNNLTVSPNGSEKIGGINADVILSTEGQSVTFVYVDGTQGWLNIQDSTSNERGNAFITATGGTITTCGNCKVHTFTSPGTFTVAAIAACASNNVVSHLVVAGGGGGSKGFSSGGGGGGGGGFREDKSPVTPYTASPLDGTTAITVTAQGYPITVGGGGAGGTGGSGGCRGSNSVFSTTTSTGGGGGHTQEASTNQPGGSGGGIAYGSPATAGAGNTPPVSPPQGQPGGDAPRNPNDYSGSGGGGATEAGAASVPNGGRGGAGASTSINFSPTAFSGGGGGGGTVASGSATGGAASPCGTGGSGKPSSDPATAPAGTTNRGGGGGGGGNSPSITGGDGGNGGSGIVIIRYKYQ